MDPTDFFSFNHQITSLGGEKTYHYVDQKPEGYDSTKTVTLLLIHGFPDLWYGWRHQIGPWVKRGYRVIAPDCAGYGGSYKPEGLAPYTPKSISHDLAALLTYLEIPKVFVVAHDWGAAIAWRFCAFEPDRVLGLVAASIPFNPPAKSYIPPSEVTKRVPQLGYMEYFHSEAAPGEIESRLYKFFNLIFRRPSPTSSNHDELHDWPLQGRLRSLLFTLPVSPSDLVGTPEEMEVYLRSFASRWEEKGSGMRAPLAYYKTGELRVAEEKDLPSTLPADLPILFLHPLQDATCVPSQVDRMRGKFIPHIQVATLDCGHWVMLGKPDEVTALVIDFVEKHAAAPGTSKL